MYHLGRNTLLFFAICMTACGDTSVSDDINDRNDMGVVASAEELPPCTAENEGEPFFVKSEKLVRVCSDAKWFAIKNEDTEKKDSSNSEQGCYVSDKTADSLWVTCGSYSFSVPTSGANNSSSVVLDSEKIATSLEGVSGFTQKGPFLMGSEVNVIELKDGRTLDQTGDNFEAKIQSDDGQFKLNARMMMSQYLELHAKGYYRNEVSGKNSNAQLTLYALTDVMMRSGGVVNINLLTHLEYHRVVYLVKNKKMKVAAAKDTAEREIFNLLHIDSKDFFSSEDLNIVGSSEGDAALLAFSVMFQGDRDVSQLSELLTNVSTDMEKDGKWDNAKMRDSIADWAENADATGRLETIRANVEDWGLSSMVPNFEKYIRSFWTKEYGIPMCDKDNVDKVVAAGSERLAESKNRFVCVDSAGVGYMWRRATNLEKDTYGWPAGTDGQIKSGDINTSAKYVYDSVMGHWREMTELEKIYGFCNEGVEFDSAASVKPNKSDKIGNEYYPYVVCTNRHWEGCSAYYADTRKYPSEASDGSVRRGDYTTNTYVYETDLGFWRVGWAEEGELGQGCTASKYGQVVHFIPDYTDANFYYSCRPDSFLVDYGFFKGYEYYKPEQNVNGLASDDEHWVQTQFRWHEDNYEVGENTFTDGAPCNDGEMVPGHIITGSKFVCDGGFWRAATVEEETFGQACVTSQPFMMVGSMVCSNGKWRKATVYDYDLDDIPGIFFNVSGLSFGELYDSRDGRNYRTVSFDLSSAENDVYGVGLKTIGDDMGEPMVWMAENLNFAGGSDYPYLDGHTKCYNNDSLNCKKGGRFYTWAAAMNLDDKWNYGLARDKDGLVGKQHQGICPEGWHIPDRDDWFLLFNFISSEYGAIGGFSSGVGYPGADNGSGFSVFDVGGYWSGNTGLFERRTGFDVEVFFVSSNELAKDKMNAAYFYIEQVYGDVGLEDKARISTTAEIKKGNALSVRCVKNYTLDVDYWI